MWLKDGLDSTILVNLVMSFVNEGEEREGCGFLTEVGKHCLEVS